jgi:hypothetical protein
MFTQAKHTRRREDKNLETLLAETVSALSTIRTVLILSSDIPNFRSSKYNSRTNVNRVWIEDKQ